MEARETTPIMQPYLRIEDEMVGAFDDVDEHDGEERGVLGQVVVVHAEDAADHDERERDGG